MEHETLYALAAYATVGGFLLELGKGFFRLCKRINALRWQGRRKGQGLRKQVRPEVEFRP